MRPTRRWLALRAAGVAWLGALVPVAGAETLTLAQCLRETAEHNPTIVQGRYSVLRSEADRLVLRARALPTLTLGGIVGELQEESVGTRQTRTSAATATRDDTTFIALGTETLYQPLFDAAIPASFRRGTAAVLAQEESFYTVAVAELHLARTLFLEALFQQRYGEVLREADASLAGNVRQVGQLASAGIVGQTNLLSAQTQRANFNPIVLATTGNYRTNVARLLQAMGRDAAAPGSITLAGTLGETLPAFDSADASRRALERRPDLRNLRALIRAYGEDVNIARAGYYPLVRVYVAGEAVPQSNVRSNNPDAVRASDQVNVTEIRPGADESWTIIDPGTTRGAVRSAKDQRDLLAISLARLERKIPADLSVVRARLADAAATAAVVRGSVDTARSTLDIVNSGVTQGINSQLEFLDAQAGFYNLRGSLLAAGLEISLAHAEFDRITGNYLQFVDANPPARK